MESYEILWNQALNELENTITPINYSTFIVNLEPVDIVGTKLILITKTETFAKMTKTRLQEKIKDALIKTHSGITDIDILVSSSKAEYIKEKASAPIIPELESSPIDPKYTFENFVVGKSNEFLYAAAKAVAEAPGVNYNPLFIYGSTGLGKTHIMHAIVNYLHANKPEINVLYASCEKFTNDLIATIRSGKAYSGEGMSEFRNRYRNVDVLIIDDVQFLARKQSTQEEFFHTFNELYSANKQIILSADCQPSEIELLDKRLETRFEGGIKAQVVSPDIETKIAILQKKAEMKKYILSLEVASYIAENSEDDVRSLEGLLNKVIFNSILRESPITLALAMDAIKDSVSVEQKEAISTADIINTVCSFYKISKSDLISKKRNKELVEPRQICAYLMTELMTIPLVTIGQALGGKNYATVIHSRDKINELVHINGSRIATEVSDIKNLILKK